MCSTWLYWCLSLSQLSPTDFFQQVLFLFVLIYDRQHLNNTMATFKQIKAKFRQLQDKTEAGKSRQSSGSRVKFLHSNFPCLAVAGMSICGQWWGGCQRLGDRDPVDWLQLTPGTDKPLIPRLQTGPSADSWISCVEITGLVLQQGKVFDLDDYSGQPTISSSAEKWLLLLWFLTR